jgi:hypothetical protein
LNRLIRHPLVTRASLLALASLEIVALSLSFEKPAHAYVDPGSGFVFLQVAGSTVAGALFYLRSRVKKLFVSARKSNQPASQVAAKEAAELRS